MTTEIKYIDPDTGKYTSEILNPFDSIRIGDTIVQDYDTYAEASHFIIPGMHERVENTTLPHSKTKDYGLIFMEHWTEGVFP